MPYRLLPALRLAARHAYRDPWCRRPGSWTDFEYSRPSAFWEPFFVWPSAGPETTANQSEDPNRFKIKLNLKSFKPEDIKVKLVENQLDVTAKREEKTESGFYMNREFSQSYVLPPTVDLNELVSTLDASGQLTLEAPITAVKGPEEREIPVVEHNSEGGPQANQEEPTAEKSGEKKD